MQRDQQRQSDLRGLLLTLWVRTLGPAPDCVTKSSCCQRSTGDRAVVLSSVRERLDGLEEFHGRLSVDAFIYLCTLGEMIGVKVLVVHNGPLKPWLLCSEIDIRYRASTGRLLGFIISVLTVSFY